MRHSKIPLMLGLFAAFAGDVLAQPTRDDTLSFIEEKLKLCGDNKEVTRSGSAITYGDAGRMFTVRFDLVAVKILVRRHESPEHLYFVVECTRRDCVEVMQSGSRTSVFETRNATPIAPCTEDSFQSLKKAFAAFEQNWAAKQKSLY